MCRDSVVCAYFVAVGFGEVGSVNGEAADESEGSATIAVA